MLKKVLRLVVLMVFALAIGFSSSAQSNGTYGGSQKDYSPGSYGGSRGSKIRFRKSQNRVKKNNTNVRTRKRNRYKYKMIRKERRKPFYGRDRAGRRGNSFYYKR